VLKQPEEIRGAYSQTDTAEQYIDTRFTSAWGSVMHAAQVRVVNESIRAYGVKQLIEIAPGPARISSDVSGFERGYLCEFNDSMLRVARRRLAGTNGRWSLVRGDAFHLPFRRRVDMVYTFRFIRHFEAADRARLYHQVRSVLKDGGLFVFDAVNIKVGLPSVMREGLQAQTVYDEFYRRDALQAELRQHGFTPLSLTDVIRHMTLQQQIQVLVAPRSNGFARRLIQLLEYVPGQPLEWIVVCRKTMAH
jgi:ubiquinone/menaquinone biosynthesis C-methylase UbiE